MTRKPFPPVMKSNHKDMQMNLLVIGLMMLMVLVAAAYRSSLDRSEVERRVVRSLKASLRRAENTPQRRILALSRMTS